MLNKIIIKLGIYLLFLFIIFALFVLILEIANLNKAIYGSTLGGEDITWLKKPELEYIIDKKIEEINKIKIKTENEQWTIKTRDLGLKIDKNKTLNLILKKGKNRNIFSGIKIQLLSLIYKTEIQAYAYMNEDAFEDYFSKHIEKINSPSKNSKIIYDKNDIKFTEEEYGLIVDKEALKKDILENFARLNKKDINIKFKASQPKITKEALKTLKNDIIHILDNSPYALYEDKNKITEIKKEDIKNILTAKNNGSYIYLSLNDEKLKELLIQISPSVNKKAKNAILTINKGKVSEFKLSEDGKELDIEESKEIIKDSILNKKINIIELSVKNTPADIRTETISNLGIVTKISSGVSDFSGSPASRIHNIKLGAEKINGTLIKPGEEFSFVEKLGEISKKAGYKASYVIKNKKTIPEYGGGLCQVSTTTFRAAIWAGLKITERFPHSYPVKYYDPQGFDAAIYGPHPDLRFVNNTPATILVQAYTKGTKLYFDFYGTDDGRKIKLTGPIVYEKNPDGSLKTKLTREVYDKNGELINSKTFWSSYKSKKLYPIIKNPLE